MFYHYDAFWFSLKLLFQYIIYSMKPHNNQSTFNYFSYEYDRP